MSFCRWSSDNFRCDLYVYEDASGGWTIHVAGRRNAPDTEIPEVPPYPAEPEDGDAEKWLEAYRAQMDAVEKAKYVPIDLPHAGETFNEPTRQATLVRLQQLRALGYHYPDRVEERLLNEIAEENA